MLMSGRMVETPGEALGLCSCPPVLRTAYGVPWVYRLSPGSNRAPVRASRNFCCSCAGISPHCDSTDSTDSRFEIRDSRVESRELKADKISIHVPDGKYGIWR